ncbi:MAG: hypothetical protein ACOX2O_09960 [Bdellovibrionota bacterium]|jgi:hypothetical protein
MFGGNKKVKINSELYSKLEKVCAMQGCSSVDEYVAGILEIEADKVLASGAAPEMSAAEIEDIANKLKGLGYLE